MFLADAIESWGEQHRRSLNEAELVELAQIWRTIRDSQAALLNVETMTKDDARSVMGLFEPSQRATVSSRLNSVRTWSLSRIAPPPIVPDVDAPSGPRSSDQGIGSPPIVEVGAQSTATPTPARPRGPVEPLRPVGSLRERGAPGANRRVIGGVALAAIVLLGIYLLFLRGDDSSDLATVADQNSAEVGGDADNDFCGVARRFEANDPLADVSFADGKIFFDRTIELWSGLAAIAPPDIAADVSTIQATMTAMRDIAAQYDYNMVDPAFGAAVAALDTSPMDAATLDVENYVSQACGISLSGSDVPAGDGTDQGGTDQGTGDDVAPVDAEALSLALFESLGITPELAECLNRELGDFDNATADAELLSKPVCGTTLLEVLSNVSG